MDTPTTPRNTSAFHARAAISFGTALFAMLVAIYYLYSDPWPKAFLPLATLFLVTSAFTLAKCIRDAQEIRRDADRPGPDRPDPGRARPLEGSRLTSGLSALGISPARPLGWVHG